MSQSAHAKKVPAHLKWLLNEHAMLLGKLSAANRVAEEAEDVARRAREAANGLATRAAELDLTIKTFDPELARRQRVCVRANDRYGKRGNLSAFLLSYLAKAGSRGVPSSELADAVIAHFGLPVDLKNARSCHSSRVRRQLRDLRASGRVVSVRTSSSSTQTLWYLKGCLP